MSRPRTSPWTDESEALLKKLWAEGLSASMIADRLPEGITRNSVIGKASRLGCKPRPSPVGNGGWKSTPRDKRKHPAAPVKRAKSQPFRKSAKKEIHVVANIARRVGVAVMPQALAEQFLIDIDKYLPCTLVEAIDRKGCRWPMGPLLEKAKHFCGSELAPGKSYCAHHAKIAYLPTVHIQPVKLVGNW